MVPIKGFSHYQVDRHGNVYSFKRSDFGIKLKPQSREHTQTTVYLYDIGGHRHRMAVSHIVAQAFIPNPNNLPNVVHKNSDRTDNRVANLMWADWKETHLVARNNGKYKQYKINGRADQIRQMRAGGMQINDIAKHFGVNRGTIRWWLLGGTYSARKAKRGQT